ncbi:hypothetical protein V8C86DRAFT_3022933 [Haematococcus lacustris]
MAAVADAEDKGVRLRACMADSKELQKECSNLMKRVARRDQALQELRAAQTAQTATAQEQEQPPAATSNCPAATSNCQHPSSRPHQTVQLCHTQVAAHATAAYKTSYLLRALQLLVACQLSFNKPLATFNASRVRFRIIFFGLDMWSILTWNSDTSTRANASVLQGLAAPSTCFSQLLAMDLSTLLNSSDTTQQLLPGLFAFKSDVEVMLREYLNEDTANVTVPDFCAGNRTQAAFYGGPPLTLYNQTWPTVQVQVELDANPAWLATLTALGGRLGALNNLQRNCRGALLTRSPCRVGLHITFFGIDLWSLIAMSSDTSTRANASVLQGLAAPSTCFSQLLAMDLSTLLNSSGTTQQLLPGLFAFKSDVEVMLREYLNEDTANVTVPDFCAGNRTQAAFYGGPPLTLYNQTWPTVQVQVELDANPAWLATLTALGGRLGALNNLQRNCRGFGCSTSCLSKAACRVGLHITFFGIDLWSLIAMSSDTSTRANASVLQGLAAPSTCFSQLLAMDLSTLLNSSGTTQQLLPGLFAFKSDVEVMLREYLNEDTANVTVPDFCAGNRTQAAFYGGPPLTLYNQTWPTVQVQVELDANPAWLATLTALGGRLGALNNLQRNCRGALLTRSPWFWVQYKLPYQGCLVDMPTSP